MSRPFALDPLFASLESLPGVGPRAAKLIQKLTGGARVLDALWHIPIDVIDRRFSPKIAEAPEGRVATLAVRVLKHFPNTKKGQPYRVWCGDETGTLTLVFFHASPSWIEKNLPEGADVVVSGRVDFFQDHPQIVHPDEIVAPESRARIERLDPVYALTGGLTNKGMHKAVLRALERTPDLPEWLDPAWQKKQRWPSWKEALLAVHFASDSQDTETARQRLAYDEFLASQLALALVRAHQKNTRGKSRAGQGLFREKLYTALPFTLTGAQERSLREIDADMAAPTRMLRLLQGDVGSGKTVVAALAMMNAAGNGEQSLLMVPTEILARQHCDTFTPWMEACGLKIALLTGRNKGREREAILQDIASGAAHVVIGTHALFQESVTFHAPGLIIIDEQHRFGVHQRLTLSEKAKSADILVMTATPIPRTLTLMAYGDLDVSCLDEKPAGRKPVDTRLINAARTGSLIEAISRQIASGARVYWVCPLVEESLALDLAAAQDRYDDLRAQFGERVGLVHGRLKPKEKDEVMARFACGEIDILVATTVIEVGVNVPEARLMVVEHADRFGLAQLHQLRGRVGRGTGESYCFLLFTPPLNDIARERLSIMRETEDGFEIAEKDLALRGGGDLLGTRQSGMPAFRIARIEQDGDLLAAARDDANLILNKDPTLGTARGEALRHLLYLFEKEQGVRVLRSG